MIRRPPRSTLFPTRRSSDLPRRSGTSTWWTGSRTERRRRGDLMRRGLTLAWVLALVAAFHWWDVTLRFPRLLVWTWAFLGLFLGTAAVLFGRGMRARRREVWLPAAVWVTLALGADLGAVLFAAVSVEGRRVAAAVWVPIVDLVLPIWMTARALALVWTGASLWSFAAVAVPALAVWAWSVMIRMPGRSHAGPLQPLTAEEAAIRRDLETHVRALAGTIGERHYARPQALARAVAYLHDALARLGYEASLQPLSAGGPHRRDVRARDDRLLQRPVRHPGVSLPAGPVLSRPGRLHRLRGQLAVRAVGAAQHPSVPRDHGLSVRGSGGARVAAGDQPFRPRVLLAARVARDHDLGHGALPVPLLSQRARYARQTGLRPARPRGRGCSTGGAGGGGGRSVGGGRRLEELLLRARAVARPCGAPRVGAVGGELPCGRIGELGREDAIEARARGGVAHRDGHLNPAAQIARPPVGGPDVIVGGTPVLEVIDARVLQEAAEDARDPDTLRQAGYAGAQHADAAHHQLDARAGLRGTVQRGDHRTVGQPVQLHPDAAAAAGTRVLGLALDQVEEAPQHVGRRDEQPAELRLRRSRRAGQLVEQRGEVRAQVLLCREQAEVAVNPGGVRGVVARAYVCVAAGAGAAAEAPQRDFSVRLEVHEAGHDVNAELLEAPRPGDVVLFVEAHNIAWARSLEQLGIHVVTGLVNLKTHAKIALVVRRRGGRIRRYAHVGTGNYNPDTARVYSDLGLFTAEEDLGADLNALFNELTGSSRPPQAEFRRLLVAPTNMLRRFLDLIEREAEHARAGRGGRIRVKLNGLADGPVIAALYRASQAGVSVELVVRGICMLRPGVPGLSERIRVTSILGRFLEHARIYPFENGGG